MASHKTVDAQLPACYTEQYATDGGLRPPNLSELMAADRHLLETFYQLVNEENWNLNDAQHEYSSVRHDMVAVLHPRPKPSSAAASRKGRKRTARERTPPPTTKESKGKGKKRSKATKKGPVKAKA